MSTSVKTVERGLRGAIEAGVHEEFVEGFCEQRTKGGASLFGRMHLTTLWRSDTCF